MIVSLIVAMNHDRVIGMDNQLPWHLPADLAYFKQVTLGKPIIMGRKTYASIGRPLPKRTNIVISRTQTDFPPDVLHASNLQDALAQAGNASEVMIIGGAEIYQLFLPQATRLYITQVDCPCPGDTYFPELDAAWQKISSQAFQPDLKNAYPYCFEYYERRL